MKFNYRGQLKDGSMVDIIDFDGEKALCDKDITINIEDIQTIFVPSEVFRDKFIKVKKTRSKKQDSK